MTIARLETMKKLLLALALIFYCHPCFADDALYSQGMAAFKAGDFGKAAQIFEQCKSAGGASADVYYLTAVTYEHLGKFDLATTNYVTVCRSFPGTQAARLAGQALKRPAFMAVATNIPAEVRNPSLDTFPKETWVPFKRVRNSVVVEGSINGRTTPMIFDTGASSCTATVQQLKALGIEPPTGKPTGYAGGVGSAHRIPAWTILADLKLGKIERRQFPLTVIDSQIGMPLLGETFYRDLEYSIDGAASAISFKSKNSTSVLQSASAKAGVSVGADGKYVYNVPFTMEGKSIIVTAKIDGQPVQMIFDTGADISMFTLKQVQDLHVNVQNTGRSIGVGGISGRTEVPIVVVKNVQLGPIDKPLVAAVTNNAAMPRPLMGQEYFKDYPYTIDHANGVIKFQKK
jgi:predicted aspartyl protease